MNRSDVVNRALLCLAESTNDGTDFSADTNVFPIEKFIDEAGRKVVMLAPIRVLGQGTNNTTLEPTINEDGSGYVELPDHFARLVEFKMGNWMRSVRQPITETDPKYAMQYHPATRGGMVKPVVAIVGGNKLEFYSTTTDDSIETFKYIAYNGIGNTTNLPDQLLEPIAWMTASLFLTSMNELDMAAVAQQKATDSIQLL